MYFTSRAHPGDGYLDGRVATGSERPNQAGRNLHSGRDTPSTYSADLLEPYSRPLSRFEKQSGDISLQSTYDGTWGKGGYPRSQGASGSRLEGTINGENWSLEFISDSGELVGSMLVGAPHVDGPLTIETVLETIQKNAELLQLSVVFITYFDKNKGAYTLLTPDNVRHVGNLYKIAVVAQDRNTQGNQRSGSDRKEGSPQRNEVYMGGAAGDEGETGAIVSKVLNKLNSTGKTFDTSRWTGTPSPGAVSSSQMEAKGGCPGFAATCSSQRSSSAGDAAEAWEEMSQDMLDDIQYVAFEETLNREALYTAEQHIRYKLRRLKYDALGDTFSLTATLACSSPRKPCLLSQRSTPSPLSEMSPKKGEGRGQKMSRRAMVPKLVPRESMFLLDLPKSKQNTSLRVVPFHLCQAYEKDIAHSLGVPHGNVSVALNSRNSNMVEVSIQHDGKLSDAAIRDIITTCELNNVHKLYELLEGKRRKSSQNQRSQVQSVKTKEPPTSQPFWEEHISSVTTEYLHGHLADVRTATEVETNKGNQQQQTLHTHKVEQVFAPQVNRVLGFNEDALVPGNEKSVPSAVEHETNVCSEEQFAGTTATESSEQYIMSATTAIQKEVMSLRLALQQYQQPPCQATEQQFNGCQGVNTSQLLINNGNCQEHTTVTRDQLTPVGKCQNIDEKERQTRESPNQQHAEQELANDMQPTTIVEGKEMTSKEQDTGKQTGGTTPTNLEHKINSSNRLSIQATEPMHQQPGDALSAEQTLLNNAGENTVLKGSTGSEGGTPSLNDTVAAQEIVPSRRASDKIKQEGTETCDDFTTKETNNNQQEKPLTTHENEQTIHNQFDSLQHGKTINKQQHLGTNGEQEGKETILTNLIQQSMDKAVSDNAQKVIDNITITELQQKKKGSDNDKTNNDAAHDAKELSKEDAAIPTADDDAKELSKEDAAIPTADDDAKELSKEDAAIPTADDDAKELSKEDGGSDGFVCDGEGSKTDVTGTAAPEDVEDFEIDGVPSVGSDVPSANRLTLDNSRVEGKVFRFEGDGCNETREISSLSKDVDVLLVKGDEVGSVDIRRGGKLTSFSSAVVEPVVFGEAIVVSVDVCAQLVVDGEEFIRWSSEEMSNMIYDGAPTGGGVSAVRSTLRSAVKNSAVDAARDAVITTLNNALGSGCASAGVSSKEKTARLPNNRRQCQTAEANNNADDSPKPEGVSTERVGSTISMSGDIANVSDKEAGGVSALPDVSSSMRSHSKLSGTPSRFSAPRRRDLQHCVLNARDVGSSPFDYREKNQSAASPSVVFSCDGVLHDTKEENTGRNVSLQSAEAENRRPWVVDGGSPCSLRPGAGRSESLGSPALRTSSRFTPSVTGERPASSISCLRAVAARDAIASAARPSSSGSSRKLNLAQDTGNSEPFGPDFQGERLVYLGLYPDLGFGDGVNLRPPRLPAKRSTISNAYNRSKQHQNKANSGLGGELGRQRVTLPPVAEVRSETSGLYEPHSEGSAFMSTQPGPGQLGRGEYLQPHPPPQRKRLSLSFSEHQREIVQGASRSLSPQQQVPNSWAPTLQSAMRAAPSGRMPSPVFTQQSYQDSTSTLTERDGWNRLSPGSPSHHSSSWAPPYSPTGSNALSTTVDSTSQTARRLGRIASRVANAHYHCTPVGPTPSRFSMTRVQPVASRVQVRSWVPSRYTPQENAIHLYNER